MATACNDGASAPRASTPAKNNARLLPGAEGRAKAHGVSFDYIDDAHDRKTFSTLRAQAALLGWQLERDGANCALIRWNRALHCADLPAVQAALARIGGTK